MTKKISKIAITLCITMVLPMKTFAKNLSADECEQNWINESANLFNPQTQNLDEILHRWQEYEQRCSGSVVYEARLSMLYSQLGKPEKARAVLTPVLQKKSPYEYLAQLALLHADEAEYKLTSFTEKEARLLEKKYSNFVKTYPTVAEGYAFLGGLQCALGEHASAIQTLKKTLDSPMNLSGVYRHLTVSYSAIESYENAVTAGDAAYAANKAMSSDQYFMYALAKAYAATGNLRGAEVTLRLIAEKKPEVRKDPQFAEAVAFVTAKINAAKK